MSYLSTALNRIAEKQQLRQADVMRAAGLTRSHVSRIFSGDQRIVTDTDFTALLRAFGKDPHDQAELVAARCEDARVGPGSGRVEICIKRPETAAAIRQTPSLEFKEVKLSHETERAFAWLRSQCPLNPALERHLVGYAQLTGMPASGGSGG
jgi:transcriptional regulator with XRE-family HTH domain